MTLDPRARQIGSCIAVVGLLAFLAGCSKSPKLVEVNSADYGDTECQMKVAELERNATTSKLRLTYTKLGSSVGSSMFIMRGFYEVATARGTEYFFNLEECEDEDGGRLYIGGFTNNKEPDFQAEFGEEFSPTNKYGQAITPMSVSQCDMLWANKKG